MHDIHTDDIHAHRILILDFGAQYTQLIARQHPRDRRVLRNLGVGPRPGRYRGKFNAEGHHPLRRAGVDDRRRIRRVRRAQVFGSKRAACWASATACRRWRCSSAGWSKAGITANSVMRKSKSSATDKLLGSAEATIPARQPRLDVWMSHGDRVTADSRRAFSVTGAHRRACRSSRWPTKRGTGTACSSIPKSRIRNQGETLLRRFVLDICGCAGAMDSGEYHR